MTETVRCPKCEYQRQPKDDRAVSPEVCPKCGVIYAKAIEANTTAAVASQLSQHHERKEVETGAIFMLRVVAWGNIALGLLGALVALSMGGIGLLAAIGFAFWAIVGSSVLLVVCNAASDLKRIREHLDRTDIRSYESA